MSKERALRRAEREREAAIKAAARAAQAERRDRRSARRRAMTSWLPTIGAGTHQGVLARRRRIRTFVLVDLLVALNIVLWFISGDWAVRLGAVIVCVLVFPVLRTVVFSR
jgi:hypothetical protein